MDEVYQMKLEAAASAPDSAFPELLFNPLKTDFGDSYYRMDYESFGQEAVLYDPRFTRRNILRIKGTEKRIDVYLENLALYEDYMDYLKTKYGSVDVAYDMDEAGLLKDTLPRFRHPPMLKKGKELKLLKMGIVPSFMARGIDPSDVYANIKEALDLHQEPVDESQPEPDIHWAMNHKLSKEERQVYEQNLARYRRQHRVEQLLGGSKISGVTSNMDFVANYYQNYSRGLYDTSYTDNDRLGNSLVANMIEAENREYWHEGQKLAAEEAASGGRFSYDGYQIVDRNKDRRFKILKMMQEQLGINIMDQMNGMGLGKKRIQAVRAGLESVGAYVGMTEKEMKKLKKKQRKLASQEDKIMRADDKLSQILLNNKIFRQGGTVRFEDMERRSWSGDDD